jgi:hypothetical protein
MRHGLRCDECGGKFSGVSIPIIFGALVQRGFWILPFFIPAGVLLTGALILAFLIDAEKLVIDS